MSVPLNYPIPPDANFYFNPNDPNRTNIIFDDKLKRFIPNAIIHMNRLFPQINNLNYGYLERKSNYLKKYVSGHKHDLNLVGNNFTRTMMADMFAICVCMLLGDISMYNYWEELKVQSIIRKLQYWRELGSIGVDDFRLNKQQRSCCCGKTFISPNSIFLCHTEHYSVLFGCDCIEKMSIALKQGSIKRAKTRAIKKEIDDEIAERRAIRRLMKQVFKQILSQKQRRNKIKEVELEDTTREEEQKLRRRFCDYDIVFDHELIEDCDGVIIEMKLVWSAKLKPQNRRRN